MSGEDVVKIIENEYTDTHDRPFAPIVIAKCGELVLQRTGTKRKTQGEDEQRSSSEESSSDSDSSDSEEKREKQKRKKKN